jgi:hypothetical protein
VWIVKSGLHFEWFANEITDALELAKEKDITLDVRGYVTCDPSYTTNFPVRQSSGRKGKCCCCQDEVEEIPPQSSGTMESMEPREKSESSEEDDIVVFEKQIQEHDRKDSISVVSDTSSVGLCQCSCGNGAEESPVTVMSGRPDLRTILDRNLCMARGETAVAVCGPQGLMARTRTLVAELSDERGADKGTGAYGVAMFGEGFGW